MGSYPEERLIGSGRAPSSADRTVLLVSRQQGEVLLVCELQVDIERGRMAVHG